jgi:general secretion pathway protein G
MKSLALLRRSAPSSRRGFTLFEMLIVLTIIALLLGLVIMKMGGAVPVAEKQKARADILAFREALATYQLDCGSLPTTEQGLSALWSKPTVEPIPAQWHSQLDEEVKDPWGHPYQYRNPGKHNPDKYDVFSMGPDGLPDTADDIGNWPDAPSDSSSNKP